MAKTGFWLRGAKGKFAGATIYQGKTGTVQREIVKPTNPRTVNMTTQRAQFASLVKFYKEATRNFYKFAFERKKRGESDYNAFIRVNMGRGVILTKEDSQDINYPALGRNIIIAHGSLPEVKVVQPEDALAQIAVAGLLETDNTVGKLSQKLVDAGICQVGDIFTHVSYSFADDGTGAYLPSVWTIDQFIVDTESALPLESADANTTNLKAAAGALIVEPEDDGLNTPQCDGVIISRQTTNGLLVSHCELFGSAKYNEIIDSLDDEAHVRRAITSWGAAQPAILQGSLSVQ